MASDIQVNMAECEALGVCFDVAPDVLRPDRYGYPIVGEAEGREARARAMEAVARCPKRAIHVVTVASSTAGLPS